VLLIIKEACEIYDKKTAKTALAELRQKIWPQAEGDLLDKIADNLLGGDFDEVVQAVNYILNLKTKGI
jgi:hypothetical protein